MNRVKKLLLNTVVLTLASLLMRTIGMAFSVYLSNRIGSAGIGLYELIMSVYTLAVAIASSGVRLSTTRLVVDACSCGRYTVRDVMRLCIRYSLILGTTASAVLYLLADYIAVSLLDSPPTAVCLRILSVSLPFIAVSAALGGYFTAVRKAGNFAVVQVLEQLCRIGITVFALGWLLPRGAEYACVALVIGSCSAEALSMLLSYLLYALRTRKARRSPAPPPLLGQLLFIAVPDAVGSWVRSFLVTAKHLLIPFCLRKTGISSDAALATYGTIHGMVLPIISFPSALLGALSGLLVPEIAESNTLGQKLRIRYIMDRVLHITLLFSIGTACILFCFSRQLGLAIYESAEAGAYIRLLAPIIPIMYLDMTVDGMLKGLGLQLSSMQYNIIDAAMSLSLVWLLIPRLGITGYIITIFASELLNFYLSITKLMAVTGYRMALMKSLVKPLLSGLATSGMTAFFTSAATALTGGAVVLPAAIGLSTAFYAALLLLFGSISRGDLRWFRGIFRKA